MTVLIYLGVAVGAIWVFEILFMIKTFIQMYRQDVKMYGREGARKIWKPQRKK